MVNQPHTQFLRFLMQGQPAPQTLWLEEPALRRAVCVAYFLADTRPKHDLLHFATTLLPILLRQLDHRTQRVQVTRQGTVRGRVDWAMTFKERAQPENNSATFVCRQIQRDDQTYPNQLLKILLLNLQTLFHNLPDVSWCGECWTAVGASPASWLTQRIHRIQQGVQIALKNPRLRHIILPKMITSRHFSRARQSKNELYNQVVTIYLQYQHLVEKERLTAVHPIIPHTLLLPQTDHPHAPSLIQLATSAFAQER